MDEGGAPEAPPLAEEPLTTDGSRKLGGVHFLSGAWHLTNHHAQVNDDTPTHTHAGRTNGLSGLWETKDEGGRGSY